MVNNPLASKQTMAITTPHSRVQAPIAILGKDLHGKTYFAPEARFLLFNCRCKTFAW